MGDYENALSTFDSSTRVVMNTMSRNPSILEAQSDNNNIPFNWDSTLVCITIIIMM